MKINLLKIRYVSIEFVSSDILSAVDEFNKMLNKSNRIIMLLLFSIVLNLSNTLRISDETNSIDLFRTLSEFICINKDGLWDVLFKFLYICEEL